MMTKRALILISLIVLALSLPACAGDSPRNVILMIGDGMGVVQVDMARAVLTSPQLNVDTMRYTGFLTTRSANASVTDSAAAGTALATGFKTNNGMIGVLPDGTLVQTILEAAARTGKATGLVTTTTITHATPASFGAHVLNRGAEADIAPQLLANKIDVLFGGGRHVFLPKSVSGSQRPDERDLLAEARSAGYSVVDSRDGLLALNGGRALGLFQMGGLTTRSPEPSLAELTDKAIELLSRDPDGFFLMVEGGQIDWACHANDARGAVKQMLGFDMAIGKALAFARKRGDTLVVVTADHETGSPQVQYSDGWGFARLKVTWNGGGHSADNVPIYADGPGGERFVGLMDNTDVPKKIAQTWGIKGFAVRK